MRDTTGRVACVGDTIVYGVKNSTWVSLTRANVIEIGVRSDEWGSPKPFMRVRTDDNRDVVLRFPTFMVIS